MTDIRGLRIGSHRGCRGTSNVGNPHRAWPMFEQSGSSLVEECSVPLRELVEPGVHLGIHATGEAARCDSSLDPLAHRVSWALTSSLKATTSLGSKLSEAIVSGAKRYSSVTTVRSTATGFRVARLTTVPLTSSIAFGKMWAPYTASASSGENHGNVGSVVEPVAVRAEDPGLRFTPQWVRCGSLTPPFR